MRNPIMDVLEFHKEKDVSINCPIKKDLLNDRHDLLMAEITEMILEFEKYLEDPTLEGKIRITEEIVDSIYVLIGHCIAFGLPLSRVWDIKHSSNMTKDKMDTKTGRVPKGKNFVKPDFSKMLQI